MNKRPKSREETPKEGSDRARPYRTATICGRAAQNARVFGSVRVQSGTGWRIGNSSGTRFLCKRNQCLTWIIGQAPAQLQCWYAKTRNIVMSKANRKSTLKRSLFESRFESQFANPNGNNAPSAVRNDADWDRQEAVFQFR